MKKFTELYQRVDFIARKIYGSQTKLASRLGLPQTTLSGYLKKGRQHKLYEHLEFILADRPELSREWLYFGYGIMQIASDNLDDMEEQAALDELNRLRKRTAELETALKKRTAFIHQDTRETPPKIEGITRQTEEQKEADYLRQRIVDLERENKALNGQIEALNKVVALQAQPLIGNSPFTTERGAALPRSAAPSSTEGIDKTKDKTPPRPRK